MSASLRRSGLLFVFAAGLFVAGCNSSDAERARAAAAYDRRANEKFQDEDVATALTQRLAAPFPGLLRVRHEAVLAGKQIIAPRLRTPASFGTPPAAAGPAERFIAGIVIDREGRVAAFDFAPFRSTPISRENRELAQDVVSAWRFAPMTINGETTASIHAFEVVAVGGTIYVPDPSAWR